MTKKQKHLLVRIIVAAVLFAAGGLLHLEGWAELGVYLVCYAVIGWDIVWKAITNILHGQVFDENFLMTIATVGALILGEHSEGVAVMLFYQVGEWFQSYAVSKSRRSITSLMDIRPDYANIEKDGKLIQVDPEDVKIGDTIIVKPGERVPLDGKIIKGSSTLDTSALTGESMPREVEAGMEVISGCINQTGILTIQTTKEFGESTVAKILDLVENASDKKGRMENFIGEGKQGFDFAAVSSRSKTVNANRLQLHALAYSIFNWFRRLALPGHMGKSLVDTVRLKLLKIATKVVHTGRYIKFKLCSSCPYKEEVFETFRNIWDLAVQPG